MYNVICSETRGVSKEKQNNQKFYRNVKRKLNFNLYKYTWRHNITTARLQSIYVFSMWIRSNEYKKSNKFAELKAKKKKKKPDRKCSVRFQWLAALSYDILEIPKCI